jgi:hypothetical protein
VFVKLTLPDGSSKATMDCSIGVAGQQQQQQQNSQQPGEQPVAGVLSWYGKTFHVGVQHLIKVSWHLVRSQQQGALQPVVTPPVHPVPHSTSDHHQKATLEP